jgi:hypothetical protein
VKNCLNIAPDWENFGLGLRLFTNMARALSIFKFRMRPPNLQISSKSRKARLGMAKQRSRTLSKVKGIESPDLRNLITCQFYMERRWDHGTLAVKQQGSRWEAHGIHDLDRTWDVCGMETSSRRITTHNSCREANGEDARLVQLLTRRKTP